jgi:hypothetical protein
LIGFELISEGFVTERQPNTPTAVAAGSRCAVTKEGEVACTYMVQSALGINDFVPMLARSSDGGATWQEQGPIWPHLASGHSLFGSLSRSPAGELFLYGTDTPIDRPGEGVWCEATQGLKQNQLFWARSSDSGRTWTAPLPIPMPIPGSAEAAGPLCITRSGRWVACYAPYNTFDPSLRVERNQIVALLSDDQGRNWSHTSMLRFKDVHSGGAEAWVIELADGRLLGTSWHMSHKNGSDYPNPYALSLDTGTTWQPTGSTGIWGHTTALAPLPDGRALFIYVQRKHGEIGVWLAVANPTASHFGVEANQIIWRAETPIQRGLSVEHSNWQDYAFGEPSVTLLPDGTPLATLWCIQPSGRGIKYLKLKAPNR